MNRSEWNDDEQGQPAPLPAHERVWRHPSEVGQQAWVHSEPPLAIGRGLTAVTGAIGGLLAMAVLWTMLPTQAGRDVVATGRSTVANPTGAGLAGERGSEAGGARGGGSATSAPATSLPRPTASSVGVSTPGTKAVAQRDAVETTLVTTAQRPLATYQLQQGTDLTRGAVAVAVNDGSLVITTAQAVTADLTVQLVLSDGSVTSAQVLFVDDRRGLAVLAPLSTDGIESFTVATEVLPGDQLTFFGDEQMSVAVGDDGSIDATWGADESIREGTPVVNQRGELVALCSHSGGPGRLVRLDSLDDLQRAMNSSGDETKVWMGLALGLDELTITAVDPAGPAAAAGLVAGDVIVSLDDAPVGDNGSVATLLAAQLPGDTVRLGIRRADGSEAVVAVVLGSPKTTV
ncbi:MAG: PDZ domain-containing protein [Ilumatobacteraceae bacterium]